MPGKSLDIVPGSHELLTYERQLNSLHGEVEEGIPKWVDSDFFKKFSMNISDSDDETKNMLSQVPENERNFFIAKSAHIQKQYNGLTMKQSFRLVKKGEQSSDFNLKILEDDEKFDEHDILELVYKAINEGKDPFDGIQVPDGIEFINPQINKNLKDNNGILYLDNLPKDIQGVLSSGIRMKYTDLLYDRVLKFLGKNPDTSPESLFDNDEFLEFYVNFFNVVNHGLGKPHLNYTLLSEDDKKTLKDDFKAELSSLDFKVYDVNANLLREKEERDRRIREENQRRFEQWKKRNETINNSSLSTESNEEDDNNTKIPVGSPEDIQNASGETLAENAGLGKQLLEQNKNNDEIEEDLHSNEEVFSTARSRFIGVHGELKSSITEKIMLKIYDKDTNKIKTLDDDAWDGLREIFKDHPDELKNVYEQISYFPKEVDNVRDELTKSSKSAIDLKNENENNRILGEIIDYVRNMFEDASKGLKLKEQEPVKIELDNLVISGNFDGADVTIRYNLKSGEVFMNSFVQYDDDNSKMIIGNNSVTNYKVGQLASFDNMLTNYESLNSQFDSLGNIIADKSIKQSSMNSTVIKFMKTFNITKDNQEDKNVVLDKGSDLFDVLQIIKNTEDLNTLEKFQDFMEIIMDYACLKWGDNNLHGSQREQSNGDKYNITFNENNKNEYISAIRECANNFSENPLKLSSTDNLSSDYHLGFADLIKKYITTEVGKPNWELAPDKIDNFINHLKTDNKE